MIVGRFNGMGKLRRIGTCLWSFPILFTLTLPYVFVLYHLAPLLLGSQSSDLELAYYRPLLLLLPFQMLTHLLTDWFVGMGRVRIIHHLLHPWAAAANILIDRWLIFGGAGIEPMGIIGAAYGTGIAQALQTVLLSLAASLPPCAAAT